MNLPVNLTAVPDPHYCHDGGRIINVVNDPVIPGTDTPRPLPVSQLLTPMGSWILGKGKKFCLNLVKRWGGDRFQVSLGLAKDDYFVAHLRFLRISARACSSGMPVSPEAFASSYARISSRSSSSSRIFSYSSMLRTTATFSPRSFTTNWRSFPIGNSRKIVYSRAVRRTIGNHARSAQRDAIP